MQKKCTVLIVPGYENSGPGHWQTLWEQENPDYIRVQQRDWLKPVCSEWVKALDTVIRATPCPKVLVGHSLGCTTITKWAENHRVRLGGFTFHFCTPRLIATKTCSCRLGPTKASCCIILEIRDGATPNTLDNSPY